jgi:hypothetical protein
MFRLLLAAGIVAFIFVHSPERSSAGFAEDAERWASWTKREMAEAAIRSGAAQELLKSAATAEGKPALRHTH